MNQLSTTQRIMCLFCGLIRGITEYGFPVLLFFVAPFWPSLIFCCLFVIWQAYSWIVIRPMVQSLNEELQKTKDHIHSVVRRYRGLVREDAYDFLFAFVESWDKHLNPEYYTDDVEWNATMAETLQGEWTKEKSNRLKNLSLSQSQI